MWDLLVADELRSQRMGGHQEDGHPGGIHGGPDLLEPFVACPDVPVVPSLEEALFFEDAEVFQETVLPDLILVAVADEDRRHWGHAVILACPDGSAESCRPPSRPAPEEPRHVAWGVSPREGSPSNSREPRRGGGRQRSGEHRRRPYRALGFVLVPLPGADALATCLCP